MRCKICDASIDDPKFNKQLDDWEVCGTCLEIIFSVFEDYPEQTEESEPDEADEWLEEALEIIELEEYRVKEVSGYH